MKENNKTTSEPIPFALFGRRLNAVMELGGLSNSTLARSCNVDPSHISRFRNGLRSPKSNPILSKLLTENCFEQISQQDKLAELIQLMQEDISDVKDLSTDDSKRLFDSFKIWLMESKTAAHKAAEDIIYSFANYYPPTESIPVPTTEMLAANTQHICDTYIGTEGLKQAILAFLSLAISKDAKELLLYSDYPINWLEDKAYFMQWIALMTACLQKKMHMTLIHNVNRDSEEMVSAIKSWMPLYMSGNIDPYYSTKDNGNRFYHTLFVCPGIAAIESWQAADNSLEGIFHFMLDQDAIDLCVKSFESMMKNSRHLLKVSYNTLMPGKDTIDVLESDAFPNVRVIREKKCTIVQRLTEPQMSFLLYHPLLVKAFSEL